MSRAKSKSYFGLGGMPLLLLIFAYYKQMCQIITFTLLFRILFFARTIIANGPLFNSFCSRRHLVHTASKLSCISTVMSILYFLFVYCRNLSSHCFGVKIRFPSDVASKFGTSICLVSVVIFFVSIKSSG